MVKFIQNENDFSDVSEQEIKDYENYAIANQLIENNTPVNDQDN